MYNVTIKHRQFEGGVEHWTVPARPYMDALRDNNDFVAIIFFEREITEEDRDPPMIDWIVLPKDGFGYVRSVRLKDSIPQE